jgi:hypothetical protein
MDLKKGDRVEVLRQVQPDTWRPGTITSVLINGAIVQLDSGVIVEAHIRHIQKEVK